MLARFAIGATIVWAAVFEFSKMMAQGHATVEDILLLFIFLELGARGTPSTTGSAILGTLSGAGSTATLGRFSLFFPIRFFAKVRGARTPDGKRKAPPERGSAASLAEN